MTTRLKDVADLSRGLSIPRDLPTVPVGGVLVIQLKDLGTDDRVHLNWAARVAPAKLLPGYQKYRVQAGDILVRARGLKHTAALVPDLVPAEGTN